MLKRLSFLLLLLLLAVPALADSWTTLSTEEVRPYYLVNESTMTVRLTFLGDCTLGGEDFTLNRANSFAGKVRQYGAAYPFRGLTKLTAADDITVANLEGVLTDRSLTKRDKTFCFIGGTDMTEVLKAGSIECVTLANNHTYDYGEAGCADTKAALDTAGIAWFSQEDIAFWERDGLRIGFAGVHYSVGGENGKRFEEEVRALRELGCAAIIAVMHAGQEYAESPNSYQEAIAKKAAELGCCLVVGHHPHVVQGYSESAGIPVVYSLGNCAFGGNAHPTDTNALVLQAVLSFEEGELKQAELHFYPISMTGTSTGNDYSPVLLSGQKAERVLRRMEQSTGTQLPAFDAEEGAVLTFVYK